jgi:hypothetical protein
MQLDLRQQPVQKLNVGGRLDLRQVDGVDAIARGLDHVHDVAVAPRRIGAVDAHADQSRPEVERAQRLDDDRSGGHFL